MDDADLFACLQQGLGQFNRAPEIAASGSEIHIDGKIGLGYWLPHNCGFRILNRTSFPAAV